MTSRYGDIDTLLTLGPKVLNITFTMDELHIYMLQYYWLHQQPYQGGRRTDLNKCMVNLLGCALDTSQLVAHIYEKHHATSPAFRAIY